MDYFISEMGFLISAFLGVGAFLLAFKAVKLK